VGQDSPRGKFLRDQDALFDRPMRWKTSVLDQTSIGDLQNEQTSAMTISERSNGK